MNTPDFAIITDHLAKRFGKATVIHDVNLHVPTGQVYGLLGPNGAGKSTTLGLILGLLQPTSGGVELFGQPWRRDLLGRVGASLNGPAFYGHLSAAENLEVHARLLGLKADVVRRTLERVGLAGAGGKAAGQFSTGMKSRLALGMALLTEPDLLILDEPQNGLDPEGIYALRQQLRDYAGAGKTVLISSHQLGEVQQLADVIGVLHGGTLRYQGPLAQLQAGYDSLEDAYFHLTRAGQA
ncbi:ATP-binding cassette domain-containing protein [Deinococcus radiopugnans]|uniref:ABC-2 type transport system ATP-binding protein n=1 Tax=Deinococcus radiopugnans ATCC 19172 TaxID=585398 RepID=A0ABR6NPM8_9DEIO|nr:ATP-binding cassette domain-containing protein [Deinococcus radiopugnans]MBB6015989.1 ABC-2 type transport system ATP-binding protein [Deinococcus radiopugnans ATCC 19172]